jgi:hypothetical protein
VEKGIGKGRAHSARRLKAGDVVVGVAAVGRADERGRGGHDGWVLCSIDRGQPAVSNGHEVRGLLTCGQSFEYD